MQNTIRAAPAALAVILSLAATSGADTPPEPTLDEDEVGRIVREYLLANPEVVETALRALRAKREAESLARAETAIRKNREALLAHPMSPFSGNPEGDVTVVEFFDYQCGFCRRALPTMLDLLETDKKVRVVWKGLPVLGPVSAFGETSEAALAMLDRDRPEDGRDSLAAEGVSGIEIEERSHGPVVVLSLEGRLDGVGSSDLEDLVLAIVERDATGVVLDCRGMGYINSAGLRGLLLCAKTCNAKGKKFLLAALRPRCRSTLEMSGFLSIIDHSDTSESALAALA